MASYEELLNTYNWKNFRLRILKRDGYECPRCYNSLPFIPFYSQSPMKVVVKLDKRLSYLIFPSFDETIENCTVIWNHDKFELLNIEKVPSFRWGTKEEEIEKFIKENFKHIILYPLSEKIGRIMGISNKSSWALLWYTRLGRKLGWHTETEPGVTYQNKVDELRKDFKWLYVAGLHVHHTYYQKGRMPWEYPENSLQTYCWQCHEDLHKNEKIPYLDEHGHEIGKLTPCRRCFGAGEFPEYKHVEAGICFHCRGAKYEELI